MQLQLLLNYKIKPALVGANYNKSITDAYKNENSYKTLMQQLLAKQAEFTGLEKERDRLRAIREDFERFGLGYESFEGQEMNEEIAIQPKRFPREYVGEYYVF